MRSVTYREQAQKCMALLDDVSSPDAKATLFAMAQYWHGLAQEAEEQERRDVVWVPDAPFQAEPA